jgi:tryptophan synthase alpha chain
VADGPTIQFSSQKALEKGTTLAKILGFVKRLRKKTDIPVMLISYINPIAVFGVKRFFRHAAGSGISGLLVTDLPVEESGPFQKASRESGVPLIFLVSPTTTKERKKLISRNSKAFIYAVSLTGITGARKRLEKTTIPFLEETRKTINKPLYVGFGISDPRQARMLKDHCDGIIIGSALVELIRKTPDILIEQNAELFAKKFREALNGRKPLD